MVCQKCTTKLSKLAAPDPFAPSSSSTRKIGENKLARPKFKPYSRKCKDCKQTVTQSGDPKYCHGCAFKKGVCAMCGKAMMDTSMYTMSAK